MPNREKLCCLAGLFLVLLSHRTLGGQEVGGDAPLPECPAGIAELTTERLEDGSVLVTWSNQGQSELFESVVITRAVFSGSFGGSYGHTDMRAPGDATEFVDVDAPPRTALEYTVVLNKNTSDCEGDHGSTQASSVLQTPFRRGDQDGNGTADIADALDILCSLMLGCAFPLCREAVDADNSGSVDISDALNLLGHMILGTVGVPPPGAVDCGLDRDYEIASGEVRGLPGQPVDFLGCAQYQASDVLPHMICAP